MHDSNNIVTHPKEVQGDQKNLALIICMGILSGVLVGVLLLALCFRQKLKHSKKEETLLGQDQKKGRQTTTFHMLVPLPLKPKTNSDQPRIKTTGIEQHLSTPKRTHPPV